MFPADLFLTGFDAFLFIFVRMTGLFVVAPIFGRASVPVYFKIGFSFFMSLILVNTIAIPSPESYASIYQVALIILKEFVVGVTIGFIPYLTFTAIYVAGEVMDMQIGFGISNVIDPISNIQVPMTSNLYYMIAMLIFLAINGHHWLIKALFDSYTTIPLGKAAFNTTLINDVFGVLSGIFFTGFKIAAPVVAAILITDVALGTISRMVPQLNVFVIGMPLKILVGLIVMMVTIPMFIYLLGGLFGTAETNTLQILKDLVPK